MSSPRTGNGAGKTAGPASPKSGKIDGGRAWDPKAGQNYNGNPDKIQMKQFANRRGNDGC